MPTTLSTQVLTLPQSAEYGSVRFQATDQVMVTGVQGSHTGLLPSLHLRSSRSRDQQTEPQLKVSQCQAHSLLAPSCLCFAGDNQKTGKPLDTDVTRELESIPPPETVMLRPRTLLGRHWAWGQSKPSGTLFTIWQLSLREEQETRALSQAVVRQP